MKFILTAIERLNDNTGVSAVSHPSLKLRRMKNLN